MKHVIIGAGAAGIQAAKTIRALCRRSGRSGMRACLSKKSNLH